MKEIINELEKERLGMTLGLSIGIPVAIIGCGVAGYYIGRLSVKISD